MEKILNKSSFLLKSDENKKISINILNDEEKEEKIQNKIIRSKKSTKIENNYHILFNNFKKFIEFLSNIKEEIQKQLKNNYNLLIKLKFYKEDNSNNSNSIYNLKCIYEFYPLNEDKIFSFRDENILVNGSYKVFSFLINKINDYDYREIKYNIYLDINKIIKENEDFENKNKNELSILDIVNSEEVSEYEIIQFKKIITTHSNSADFLYKLSNGYYVSGGNQRELYIYDQNLKKINAYLNYKPIGICEIKSQDNNNNIIKIVAYSYENLSIISYETNKNNNPLINTKRISIINLLQIESNIFIINNGKAGYISKDFCDKKTFKKIFKHTYIVGIKINEKLSAFTSNKVIPNGKDSLIIYDNISNKIVYEIKGYSFSLSKNCLLLIKNNKSLNSDKILICACKKYSSNQRNGILLINITGIEDNPDIFNGFYETGNFEPYCFSQILLINNSYKKNQMKYIMLIIFL